MLVYCKTAPAIKPLSSNLTSTPEGSVKDKEEVRSNTGFVGTRVDHSYDVCETLDVTADDETLLLWDGTNDQGALEGAYVSRREDDEDALIAILDRRTDGAGSDL